LYLMEKRIPPWMVSPRFLHPIVIIWKVFGW
jgi:hypothetical protein